MTENDLKRVETHLKRTFNHGGIKVKAQAWPSGAPQSSYSTSMKA